MGLTWRRRTRLDPDTTVNQSTRGASMSRRLGPFTISSRGRVTMRLGKGWSWRIK